MNYFSVDSEEMAKRTDEDLDAVLKMIGEGSPIFYPSREKEITSHDALPQSDDE